MPRIYLIGSGQIKVQKGDEFSVINQKVFIYPVYKLKRVCREYKSKTIADCMTTNMLFLNSVFIIML